MKAASRTAASPTAVFDANVVLLWMIEGPLSPVALKAGESYRPMAPTLLGSEVANALRTQVKAGLYELDWCLTQMRRLPKLVHLEDERDLWPLALRLAAERDHAAYDCVYVAMAMTRAIPLITGDAKLARKFSDLPGLELRTLRDWAT
jgi:predicted nucleic acid-binding protein